MSHLVSLVPQSWRSRDGLYRHSTLSLGSQTFSCSIRPLLVSSKYSNKHQHHNAGSGTRVAMRVVVPRLYRPSAFNKTHPSSAPSYKRPYSPSPLRALVSSSFSLQQLSVTANDELQGQSPPLFVASSPSLSLLSFYMSEHCEPGVRMLCEADCTRTPISSKELEPAYIFRASP